MRREILIRSALPPEQVLAGLRERSREWRESAMPAGLREQGVHGVQILLDGQRFRMRAESSATDYCEVRCRGTVSPDGAGSIIRATTRQDNPALYMVAILAVILAITVAREPTWASVVQALALLWLTGVVASAAMLLTRRQTRHRAEAAEFERILEGVAWPPSSSGSAQVAV